MAERETEQVYERARRLGVRTYRFYRWMEKLLAAADLVVTMGGYNTICEILTLKTPSLIIPRESPRTEQLIRAQVLRDHDLADYIPWHACTPDLLHDRVVAMIEHPEPYQEAMARFEMTGYETMRQRLLTFRNAQLQKSAYA